MIAIAENERPDSASYHIVKALLGWNPRVSEDHQGFFVRKDWPKRRIQKKKPHGS